MQSEWRGIKQDSIIERFSAPDLVGRLPSGNQQAGSLRLVEQDWREHSTNTQQDSMQNHTAQQHKKHVIKGTKKQENKE